MKKRAKMLTNANIFASIMENRAEKMPLNQGLNHKMIRNDKVIDRIMGKNGRPPNRGLAPGPLSAHITKRIF